MTPLAFERNLPEVLTRAENLLTRPRVAMEILRLTQGEGCAVSDLADCIGRDPALAGKLLKLANSALFGVGHEITSLERATAALGAKTVKLMALSVSLAEDIPTRGTEAGFDVRELWKRSLVGAVAARALAQRLDRARGDEAFLCGLLGHFGRLVLARVMPNDYEAVVRDCAGWPSRAQEERLLGFSNADVCATLLRSWDLPELVYSAIGHSGRADELDAAAGAPLIHLVRLLEMSSLIESVLCDPAKGEPLGRLYALAGEHYGLEERELDDFVVGLEPAVAQTAMSLLIDLPAGSSYDGIMNEARLQIMEASLAATGAQVSGDGRSRGDRAGLAPEIRGQTDRHTDLPNRAAFDAFLRGEVEARQRAELADGLGLVLIDVDHFRTFNDSHGHRAGDAMLRMIGEVLRRETRRGDLAARFGGEEFALVASPTNISGMRALAERVRAAIEQQAVRIDGERLSVTASLGAACIAEFDSAADGTELVKLADHYLARAKKKGRNRCEVYPRARFPGR